MKIINRKFHRQYHLLEKYEAGIVLNGAEVKSIKAGRLRLDEAYVKIIGGEAYLVNAQIPLYPYSQDEGYQANRTRKLLLKKRELIRIKTKLQSASGLTLAPICCYNKGDLIKIEVGLAKGKKDPEKKRREKERDLRISQEREIKDFLRR